MTLCVSCYSCVQRLWGGVLSCAVLWGIRGCVGLLETVGMPCCRTKAEQSDRSLWPQQEMMSAQVWDWERNCRSPDYLNFETLKEPRPSELGWSQSVGCYSMWCYRPLVERSSNKINNMHSFVLRGDCWTLVLFGVQKLKEESQQDVRMMSTLLWGEESILHLWFTSEARTTYRVLCIVALLFTIIANTITAHS